MAAQSDLKKKIKQASERGAQRPFLFALKYKYLKGSQTYLHAPARTTASNSVPQPNRKTV